MSFQSSRCVVELVAACCYTHIHAHDMHLRQALPADVHIAGTPCVDYSSRGSKRGSQGKSTGPLFAWICQRLLLQEPYVVQENVTGFSTDLLADTMGHCCHIECATLDPAEYGWPIIRKRKYTVMRHKIKTGPMASPLNVFNTLFTRPAGQEDTQHDRPGWDIFLIGGPRELDSAASARLMTPSQAPSFVCSQRPSKAFWTHTVPYSRDRYFNSIKVLTSSPSIRIPSIFSP